MYLSNKVRPRIFFFFSFHNSYDGVSEVLHVPDSICIVNDRLLATVVCLEQHAVRRGHPGDRKQEAKPAVREEA